MMRPIRNFLRTGALAVLAGGLLVTQAVAQAQSRDGFEAAIDNTSTAPSFVLVTVVDARTGQARTGCVEAPFLLGAIHREYGFGYDPQSVARAEGIARSQRDHVFRFTSPEALANVDFDRFEANNPKACALLRQGKDAYRQDRTGLVTEGRISWDYDSVRPKTNQ